MHCKYCGEKIKKGYYCSRCGKPTYNINSQFDTQFYQNVTSYRDVTRREERGMSIAALVLGIIGLGAWLLPFIGFPVIITGLVLGILGKNKGGRGFAIAGIVLCIITLFLTSINAGIGACIGLRNEFEKQEASNEIDFQSISEEIERKSKEQGQINESIINREEDNFIRTYKVSADEQLSEDEIEDLVNKLQAKAYVYSSMAWVTHEKNDAGEWLIEIWLPNISNDVIYEDIIANTSLQFIANFGTSEEEILVTDANIESVSSGVNIDENGEKDYVVNVIFDDEGAKLLEEGTARYVNDTIYIVYDEEVISAPVVREAITGGEAEIAGLSSYEEAENLASCIRIGKLDVTLEEVD